jgi:predicted AAA+ superfamily ATPase
MAHRPVRSLVSLEVFFRCILKNFSERYTTKLLKEKLEAFPRELAQTNLSGAFETLEFPFLINRVSKYVIKTGKVLKGYDTCFIADHSFLCLVNGGTKGAVLRKIKNIIMQDIDRRGFTVYVGRIGNKTIDFVIQNGVDTLFVQLLTGEELTAEKFEKCVKDKIKTLNLPSCTGKKFLIVPFQFVGAAEKLAKDTGIVCISAAQFLLQDDEELFSRAFRGHAK